MNALTRRSFMAATSTAALALTFPRALSAPIRSGAAPKKGLSVAELARAHFEPLVGQTFTAVHPELGDVALKLVETADLPAPYQHDMRGKLIAEGFSLLFEGPADPVMPQDVVELKHDAIGACALVMVPVQGTNPGATTYEIVINRLIAD